MWGSAVLDTVLGLAFVFFAVAVLCSVVVEWWATVQRKRAKFLLRGVQAMLVEDRGPRTSWWSPRALLEERRLYRAVLAPTVGDAADNELVRLMAHPLLRAHRQTEPDGRYTRLPAYLPAAEVAAAMVDVLLDEPGTIPDRIAALGPRSVGRSLRLLWERSGGDQEQFLAGIAAWYEAQMQRVSGWYKRWSKRWLVVVGLLIAVGLGVDTLRIAHTLYTEPVVRAAAAAAAADADPAACAAAGTPAPDPAPTDVLECARRIVDDLGATGLPIGWPDGCPQRPGSCLAGAGPGDLAALVLGLALTALAGSAGAPFWFDVLSRLAPLRNNGGRPANRTP